jgi:hypothetical protein
VVGTVLEITITPWEERGKCTQFERMRWKEER